MIENTGAAAVDVLANAGVRRFYTVPGESFMEVIDAVDQRPELRLVSTRHEAGAAFMAEAEAKLTGVPAVAMGTRGVGAANLAIGVHTAYQDSTPMVVLLGQVDSTMLGREAFQEIDLTAFYTPITKWSVTLSRARRLPELVERGLYLAQSGRPGPVMIALPADLLAEEIDWAEDVDGIAGVRAAARGHGPAMTAESRDVVAAVLARAHRPVVIAGAGAQGVGDSLIQFIERYGLGLYASWRRQDVIPNSHPNYLGHLGLGAVPECLVALDDADVVLVLGSRLSEVTTQGYRYPRAGTTLIEVNIDASSMGTVAVPDHIITCTVQNFVASMLANPSASAGRDWRMAHRAYLSSTDIPRDIEVDHGVHPAQVIESMAAVLPADTVIANDAGNFSAFLHRHWRYEAPSTQLAPTSGAMGYAVPAAIGAKIARPERTVVGVAGDGGFLMSGQEIETAVRERLDITIIILKNGLYGTIAMHQARMFARTAGVSIGDVDLAHYAESLGARGYSVDASDDLADAIKEAVHADGPAVVDVTTDPEIIAPGKKLSELSATALRTNKMSRFSSAADIRP